MSDLDKICELELELEIELICCYFARLLDLFRYFLLQCYTGQHSMSAYDLTVYRGTFIHLPRIADHSTTKPQLVRHSGALWVSSQDGRIKGFDWSVQDDSSFRDLLSRNGWTDVEAHTNGVQGPKTNVKIVTAREDRNEFFFPGFIGKSSLKKKDTTPLA